jgi:hypothetical protein
MQAGQEKEEGQVLLLNVQNQSYKSGAGSNSFYLLVNRT